MLRCTFSIAIVRISIDGMTGGVLDEVHEGKSPLAELFVYGERSAVHVELFADQVRSEALAVVDFIGRVVGTAASHHDGYL